MEGERNILRFSSKLTSSVKEGELEVSKVGLSISQDEGVEVVIKLFDGKALGVDEIRPEVVVGMFWVTSLCNIA